jgi:hypothetical protein
MGPLNAIKATVTPESRQVVYGTFQAIYGHGLRGGPFAWFCPAHPLAEAATEGNANAKSLADAKAGAERHARSHTRFVTIHMED